MSIRPLGFVLVGCGRIAPRYLDLLNGPVEGARLIAVCDVKWDRADTAAKKTGVAAYTVMHEMMRAHQDAIDVVCVLTESGLHAEHSIALAP